MMSSNSTFLLALSSSCLLTSVGAISGEFVGEVLDAETGHAIPARVYVRETATNEWLFVQSASPIGSALPYAEQWVPQPKSVEQHTTVSPHPFQVRLQPGTYQIRVERGKEYFPATHEVEIVDQDESYEHTFRLRRWINLAERGWYSGETHVHRRVRELANVMLAENLNVAFPVTYWTIDSSRAPDLTPSTLRQQGPSPFGPRVDYGSKPIELDATHLIYPRNTEYEVFRVDGKPHVLGAIFILNHQTRFAQMVPPIEEVARVAHAQGALLDLDKHSWPWSMMLIPIAKVDLYELANNSLWRTEFGFRRSLIEPAPYMHVETDAEGMTERGWVDYGLQNYYSLLNCGFRLQPTAGTASGVHPVPLGFGRVYVQLEQPFQGEKWIVGLRQGRSFVTTGPIMLVEVNQQSAGHVFKLDTAQPTPFRVQGEVIYTRPIDRIEVIVNGGVVDRLPPQNSRTSDGAYRSSFDHQIVVQESSWVALRCFHYSQNRVRFAHTAPWHIEINDQPVRPRREEVEYLIRRVSVEIERNRGVLSPLALAEFEKAFTIYQRILRRARP